MKQAFLITAYTDSQQLVNLVTALDHERSNIYIHLDKKSKIGYHRIVQELAAKSNVHFISNPVNVQWGGFSHLQALLLLLGRAFSDKENAYFHALSGQDLPLLPIGDVLAYFDLNQGKEFLSHARLDQMNWSGGSYSRLHYYHLNDWFNIRVKFWKRINARMLQMQRLLKVNRQLPGNFASWHGGGTWWSLSHEAVRYVFDIMGMDPTLLPAFKYTHCSEEMFFQTILLNSHLKDNVVNDDLRYVDWNTRDGQCPLVLDERDLASIRKSNKLFGRKFVSGVSDGLAKKLIATVSGQAPSGSSTSRNPS